MVDVSAVFAAMLAILFTVLTALFLKMQYDMTPMLPDVIEETMKTTPRRIAYHVLILIIVFVVSSLVAVWLGLGPTIHSALI